MSKPSVILGISGGIDSSAAADLLLQAGYDVHTLTLLMLADDGLSAKAQARAQQIGTTHHTLDVSNEFQRQIIDYFTDSYISGRTPAPCTMCNPLIKWRHLAAYADSLGIDHIATGHYFNIVSHNNHLYISRAADRQKDQSYYLWGLDQKLLQRILTPMGNAIKSQIKESLSDKRESMGLCFLAGRNYRDFLLEHNPSALRRGDIVDQRGTVVGHHDGIAFYTIGQKRGFECSIEGAAIIAMDPALNRLIVGKGDELLHLTLEIESSNIVDQEELLSSDDITVIIRGIGRNPEGFARHIEPTSRGYRITLSSPAWAPAIGQPVVLYRDDRVIGGGILERYY